MLLLFVASRFWYHSKDSLEKLPEHDTERWRFLCTPRHRRRQQSSAINTSAKCACGRETRTLTLAHATRRRYTAILTRLRSKAIQFACKWLNYNCITCVCVCKTTGKKSIPLSDTIDRVSSQSAVVGCVWTAVARARPCPRRVALRCWALLPRSWALTFAEILQLRG